MPDTPRSPKKVTDRDLLFGVHVLAIIMTTLALAVVLLLARAGKEREIEAKLVVECYILSRVTPARSFVWRSVPMAPGLLPQVPTITFGTQSAAVWCIP